MTDKNKTVVNLHQLLDYDAKKFVSAEIQLRDALKAWIDEAFSMKLKSVLQRYLEHVITHKEKMEHFIADEEIYSISLANRIIRAFIEETNEKIGECADPEVKDAALLECVQSINHFKISAYGSASAFANELGMTKSAELFHEAEASEKQIDDRLSQLAEHEINARAKVRMEQ
jgi:ferritin-like metal-binding protein YciE